MRDESLSQGSPLGRRETPPDGRESSTAGLVPCAHCERIVPAHRTVGLGSNRVCPDCARELGGAPRATGSVTNLKIASVQPRMVSSSEPGRGSALGEGLQLQGRRRPGTESLTSSRANDAATAASLPRRSQPSSLQQPGVPRPPSLRPGAGVFTGDPTGPAPAIARRPASAPSIPSAPPLSLHTSATSSGPSSSSRGSSGGPPSGPISGPITHLNLAHAVERARKVGQTADRPPGVRRDPSESTGAIPLSVVHDEIPAAEDELESILPKPPAPGEIVPASAAHATADPLFTRSGPGESFLGGVQGVVETHEDYALVRRQIDAGDDSLETRKRAAEMATRLGLHLEALDHYRRLTELDPADERFMVKLQNIERAVGVEHGGRAVPLPEPPKRVLVEAPPFWGDLWGATTYPSRGLGLTVILVGGGLLGLGQLIASINLYAAAVNVVLWGYVSAYLFDVVHATGTGKRGAPDLPDAKSVFESYLFPFFASATCCLFSFLPFGIVAWADAKGWLPGLAGEVLGLATFVLGFFVLPMTLTARAMFRSTGDAVRPLFVLASIGRVLPDYVALFIATCVLWIAYPIASGMAYIACLLTLGAPTPDAVLALDWLRIVSWVLHTMVSLPLLLYALILQAHLLGLLYRQSMRRLAWFVPADEKASSPRSLSFALRCGAFAALAALCVGAWFGGKIASRWLAHPGAAAAAAACPVRDGSRLTYFWEKTDGTAGLTEYRFHAHDGDRLRITTATQVAGQAAMGAEEELGIFDPESGVFSQAREAWGQGVRHGGRKGDHVAFFGPKTAGVGAKYLNDWTLSGSDRWRDVWTAWKVRDDENSRDLYFDARTGILVGSRQRGDGFEITEWLVTSKDANGVSNGPSPNRFFETESTPAPTEK